MNHVCVHNTRVSFLKEVVLVRRTARTTLLLLKKDGYTVDLFLLSQKEMKSLNHKSRGKDVSTNVLSFAERDVSPEFLRRARDSKYLGEIYISPDFVRVHKQSLEHMVVHGILHLFGYDHIEDADAERMEKREQRLLSVIIKKA